MMKGVQRTVVEVYSRTNDLQKGLHIWSDEDKNLTQTDLVETWISINIESQSSKEGSKANSRFSNLRV